MLELLPLPQMVIWLRPEWVLLALLYWMIISPSVGFLGAFSTGVLLDLSNGTLLGEHALAIVLVAYFAIKFHQLIRVYPIFQQTIVVFVLLALYKLIIFIVQGFMGQLPIIFLYWLSIFTSALLWPWIFAILTDIQRRMVL
jgi:rod shape-determining protein MreD